MTTPLGNDVTCTFTATYYCCYPFSCDIIFAFNITYIQCTDALVSAVEMCNLGSVQDTYVRV